eukprot:TRINITY_DN25315_c0_g1_i1.p1 TRINITY_DN25315_c0_g1~~TRINITY_DN25315_c0_g1_i1.p1  ORF type:complete len:267 (+),score=46.16 TRINITY_DN25315_c0_g1_i1:38-838(+)
MLSGNQSPSMDVAEIARQLTERGVVVIEDVYAQQQIGKYRKRFEKLCGEVRRKASRITPEERTYMHTFGSEKTLDKVEVHDLDDDSELIRIKEGRYDFTYGMSEGCFADSSFHEPPVLRELMQCLLKDNYSHYAGALTSNAASDYGPWHRDTYELFDNDSIDVALPPFYFTVLIPLVEFTEENGATEFIVGSHRMRAEGAKAEGLERFQAICKPGSIVVFDGRTCHRGLPNMTEEERSVIYMVWHKMWYNDFGTLESEFPLGSWRG